MAMSFLTSQISFLIRFTSFITDEKRTDSLKEGVSDAAAEFGGREQELDWAGEMLGRDCSFRREWSRYSLHLLPFFNRDLGTVDSFLIETSKEMESSASFVASGFLLETFLVTSTSPSQVRPRELASRKIVSRRDSNS